MAARGQYLEMPLVPASGWGIHDMALESWIFPSFGLSGEVWERLRYLYPGHVNECLFGCMVLF